jgi:hypothetical protein
MTLNTTFVVVSTFAALGAVLTTSACTVVNKVDKYEIVDGADGASGAGGAGDADGASGAGGASDAGGASNGGGAGGAGIGGGAAGSTSKPAKVNGGLSTLGRGPRQQGSVRLLSGALGASQTCGENGLCVTGSIR